MAELKTPADALPLLAYKIAPRQFDVSYRFANISLRDQIVRAQMLVRAILDAKLLETDKEQNDFQLLICGAGAAGLAAAKEADARGISFVLIEKGDHTPGGVLSCDAERYVSTAMYEWPHPNHTEHEFPLANPELLGPNNPPNPTLPLVLRKPVLVKDFGKAIGAFLEKDIAKWKQNFQKFPIKGTGRGLFVEKAVMSTATKEKLREMLGNKTSIHAVPLNFAPLPIVELRDSARSVFIEKFQFQYVIYAVGFAAEAVKYADGKVPYDGYEHRPFWKSDLVPHDYLGFSKPPLVAILGSGDGALQDALRCLVNPEAPHPLDVWDRLMTCSQGKKRRLVHSPYVRIAMAEIASADGYTTGGAIWSHKTHVFKSLDEAFRGIIDRLIKHEGAKLLNAVNSLIRDDVQKVTIVNRDGYFSKAYALNRFLVLLIHEILKIQDQKHTGKLEILSGEVIDFTQIKSNIRGASLKVQDATGTAETRDCELVIIRGGLDRNAPPTQLVGLSGIDTGRAELGRIPPPIRPIEL